MDQSMGRNLSQSVQGIQQALKAKKGDPVITVKPGYLVFLGLCLDLPRVQHLTLGKLLPYSVHHLHHLWSRIITTVSLRLRSLILLSLSVCAILLGSFVEEANHEGSSDIYQSPAVTYNRDYKHYKTPINKTASSSYNWKMMSLQKLCPCQRTKTLKKQNALEESPGWLLPCTDPQGNCHWQEIHCGEGFGEATITHGGFPQLTSLPRLASRQRYS